MKLIRVFPRRTKATPIDLLSVVGRPPGFFDEADEVHVSVTFTWDLPAAERLEKQWRHVAPTKIGGPATGMRGEEFTPGRYLRPGYVVTSRGCPNRCWFCSVPKREGALRELPVTEGWNVLDDNVLACGRDHLDAVFEMLGRQREAVQFTGGLEAARFEAWHAERIAALHTKQVFFAYDTPDDLYRLERAAALMFERWSPRGKRVRAYVLGGYQGDTLAAWEARLREVLALGVVPMAMLYRDEAGKTAPEWRQLQRQWARPAMVHV